MVINISSRGLFNPTAGFGFLGAFGAALLALGLLLAFLFLAILYVYIAFAWSTIARKLGYDKPWLAWIPFANLFLVPILAKKRWPWGFLLFVPIANVVFLILWTWRIYELRGVNGAWSLLFAGSLVPAIAGAAFVGDLIVFGFAAWRGKSGRASGDKSPGNFKKAKVRRKRTK